MPLSKLPTLFSVDVETTSTDPHNGWLLTVGVQPVTFPTGNIAAPVLDGRTFYERIDRIHHYPRWFATLTDSGSTLSWWLKQNSDAQAEAFRDLTLERLEPDTVAARLIDYVETIEPEPEARVFVANPATFDKAWIDDLFAETGYPNPFHYRTLCLRSMRFGLVPGDKWGAARDDHNPAIPHHAFHDAYAQAQDLARMLETRESFGPDND